jgi:hypothetical protein
MEAPDPDSWLRTWYQTHQLDDPSPFTRHATCRILEQSDIPCVLWHEDALAYYGVKTALFHIHILVPDVHLAAEALLQRGYALLSSKPNNRTSSVEDAERWLKLPDPENERMDLDLQFGEVAVVLHCAEDWSFALPVSCRASYPSSASLPPSFIPRLQDFLDALIDKWLDDSDEDFRRRLTYYLGYLYRYVPVLHSPDFARFMKPDHRQYHADQLSGMNMGTIYCRQHEKKIRDAIRSKNYELQMCSASKDDERLFTGPAEARLLAMLNMRKRLAKETKN